MISNRPDSKAEFDRFPPNKYPIQLHLSIGKRNAHLLDEIKPILDRQTNEESRYRAKTLKHIGNNISMHCYFKNVDALRPIAWQLKEHNVWRNTLQSESNRFTPRMMIEKANSIMKNELEIAL